MASMWKVDDVSTWTAVQGLTFFVVIQLGMEILHRGVIPLLFGRADPIPKSGKHLDAFSAKDISFILFNKAVTPLFIYHLCQYVCNSDRVYWKQDEVTIANFVLPIPFFYLAYDVSSERFSSSSRGDVCVLSTVLLCAFPPSSAHALHLCSRT